MEHNVFEYKQFFATLTNFLSVKLIGRSIPVHIIKAITTIILKLQKTYDLGQM